MQDDDTKTLIQPIQYVGGAGGGREDLLSSFGAVQTIAVNLGLESNPDGHLTGMHMTWGRSSGQQQCTFPPNVRACPLALGFWSLLANAVACSDHVAALTRLIVMQAVLSGMSLPPCTSAHACRSCIIAHFRLHLCLFDALARVQ